MNQYFVAFQVLFKTADKNLSGPNKFQCGANISITKGNTIFMEYAAAADPASKHQRILDLLDFCVETIVQKSQTIVAGKI